MSPPVHHHGRLPSAPRSPLDVARGSRSSQTLGWLRCPACTILSTSSSIAPKYINFESSQPPPFRGTCRHLRQYRASGIATFRGARPQPDYLTVRPVTILAKRRGHITKWHKDFLHEQVPLFHAGCCSGAKLKVNVRIYFPPADENLMGSCNHGQTIAPQHRAGEKPQDLL